MKPNICFISQARNCKYSFGDISMASLIGRKPNESFQELLKLSEAGGTGLISLEDGAGNTLPLRISNDKLEFCGAVWPTVAPSKGTVAIAGDNGVLSWKTFSSLLGLEKNQVVSPATNVTLASFDNGFNYSVTTGVNMNLVLPSISTLTTGDVVAITVRVNQTADTAITWGAQDGKSIIFADPTDALAGSGKTTIFSFVYYGGSSAWLGGIIWKQV